MVAPTRPDRNYWFEFRPETGTLYVEFNRVRHQPGGESIDAFAARLDRFATDHRPARTVIDLRHNRGGDNTTVRGFVDTLRRNPHLNRPGRLFVLIGPGTFSAAVNLASMLETRTAATFAGQPTGQGPNQAGDPVTVRLPNSGITASVSTVWWEGGLSDDPRRWIAPTCRSPTATPTSWTAATRPWKPSSRTALDREDLRPYGRAGLHDPSCPQRRSAP